MEPFKFSQGQDVTATIKSFGDTGSQYLGGGTTLIDLMKLHVMAPEQLIDISTLPLKKISDKNSAIEVEAMVTNNEMAHHPLVKENFPFVSEALLSGASVQLRNLATTSGNILQKTRCQYFRDIHSKCNKRDPGSGCDAIEGYNRMHALLGVSDKCIATHASDLCVALMAVGAMVKTQSLKGGREIAFEQFYRLPKDTPQVENVLEPGEMIVSIVLPKEKWFRRSTYVKIRDRSSYAFALTSAAVALELNDGVVKQVRIAMGGIGTIPWRLENSEKVLTGQRLTPAKMREAAKAVVSSAQPRIHNAFKIELAQQTLIRALVEVERKV